MGQATILQTVMIVLGVTFFIAALIGVMLALTMLRRRRPHTPTKSDTLAPRTEVPITPVLSVLPPAPILPAPVELDDDTEPIPDWMLMPLSDTAPDQVVIMIEPEPGPTRQRRNIQRLIDHLQTDSPAKVG